MVPRPASWASRVVSCRHRPDVRSMLRQWRSYGRGRARLVARYQSLGLLPAESWWDAVATVAWLTTDAVDCVRGRARRACYLRVLVHVVGQVQGSRDVACCTSAARIPGATERAACPT